MAVPVSPPLWFESLRQTRDQLKSGELPLEAGIRHIYHLRQLAPGAIGLLFPEDIEEKVFRKALKKGHVEQAFDLILDPRLFNIGNEAQGSANLTTVKSVTFDASGEARKEDPIAARVIAWLDCIANIEARCSISKVD